jgi:uncharacterized Zn ribbon protein
MTPPPPAQLGNIDNDSNNDGRIGDFGAMPLKSEFIKKV